MNMIKLLWCRFQRCLSKFTMFLVRGFSQAGLFRHLSEYILRVRNLKITKSMRASLLSKCSKFHLDFKNAAQNNVEVSSFWDNCIWIGIVKLSLLRRGYISLGANALRSSPKIWHVNNREYFRINWLFSDQTIG